MSSPELTPIPHPPTIPFIGNSTLIDTHVPLHSFELLASQYGEIYRLYFAGGRETVFVNSHALTRQVSDDKRFAKTVSANLREVRHLVGDGLFTAYGSEPNWGIAHRLLMPAFSALNVRTMYDGMIDICDQLLLKWERFGADTVIDPAEDFTRLTFDTIAFCSMSYRFNSFYTPTLPIFIQQMTDFLTACNARAYRPSILQKIEKVVPTGLYHAFGAENESAKYDEDIREMTRIAREIIQDRREHPTENTKDLLTLMLDAKDPVSGESLSEEAIINNLLTFLIAGHETTSGTLTFATYYLLKNPQKLAKLRAELDEKLGVDYDAEIDLEKLGECEYLIAIMRETLRLAPTATARGVECLADHTVLIGGDGDASNPANPRYELNKGAQIVVQEYVQMRDHRVWGEDAEEWKPERMTGGAFEKLPRAAWQPFGFGARACIGRPFAWQELQLVLAAIFRRFDLQLVDPSYTLEIKQALTIKPKDMKIKASLRPHVQTSLSVGGAEARRRKHSKIVMIPGTANGADESETATGGQKMYVLYGSNTGTSEAFAQRIVGDARAHGFQASLATLDSKTNQLPTDGPVVIITASFEGEPADNAAHFVHWLESSSSNSTLCKGVAYTVFGCGNREWANTYQRIPILVDTSLEKCGAERLIGRGEGDAANANFFRTFDKWEEDMWAALGKHYNTSVSESDMDSDFKVEVVDAGTARAKLLRQPDAAMARVVENRLLSKPGTPEKRHIEMKLPEDMTYRAGDYLAILPYNPAELVKRALAHFGLSAEEEVTIQAGSPTTFPLDAPITVAHLLYGYVELSQPVTTRDLQTLTALASDEATKKRLGELNDSYEDSILVKRVTLLDLLEDHSSSIKLPFSKFLQMLPPMRVRQYSISSSPLANPGHLSLTVSILEAPALSGHVAPDGSTEKFLGVASTFLARLTPGALVPVLVRPSSASFHLPNDPKVPVVMFCAGSGLAPFRGFIEERAKQRESGREVGKMVLFFGCRAPDVDYLYANEEGGELKKWAESGVVDLRPAFSRSDDSKCCGCKYVQDRVIKDGKDVSELFRAGARFYTCGSRKVANGIRDACVQITKETHAESTEDQAREMFEKVQKERYASDIFD